MEIAKLRKNTIIEDCKTALSQKKVSEDDADIYIHPNLNGFNITDYEPHSLSVMIDRGAQSAMNHFDELKKIAGNK